MSTQEDKIKELEEEVDYWKGVAVSSQLLPFWVPRTLVNELIDFAKNSMMYITTPDELTFFNIIERIEAPVSKNE